MLPPFLGLLNWGFLESGPPKGQQILIALGSNETLKSEMGQFMPIDHLLIRRSGGFLAISEVTDFLEHWDLSMTKEAEKSPWLWAFFGAISSRFDTVFDQIRVGIGRGFRGRADK